MRKIIYTVLIVLVVFLLFKYFWKKEDTDSVTHETKLIQEQIVNVGKLVVTEGHFSEIITYKDRQKYFMDMITFEKKALIIVNAEVSVAYDLSKVKYDIDESNKIITITSIPEEEIKINPDIKFYDVEQSRLNPFTGDDYNKINKSVRENLSSKIKSSTLKSNAKNRLVSELSKILILTNTMGWQLKYHDNIVDNDNIEMFLN